MSQTNLPETRNIEDLLHIMARLRAPGGCPWDLKQTHESILNCLIEEAYEFVDAVEKRDTANMKEELGDLLLQVVFHAQMAKEAGTFDFTDVAQVIAEKLVRRHPHVFGEAQVDGSDGVQKQWDEIKRKEKADAAAAGSGSGQPAAQPAEEGPLGALPKHLPALLKAEKIQKRAAQAGFDWPDWKGPWDKVREELEEVREAVEKAESADRLESEFGDLLFAAVNLGRAFKLDPEKALARANRKFLDRYARMDALASSEGKVFKDLGLAEQDGYWNRVKGEE